MKLKQLVAVICVLPFASFAETGQNTAPTTLTLKSNAK